MISSEVQRDVKKDIDGTMHSGIQRIGSSEKQAVT